MPQPQREKLRIILINLLPFVLILMSIDDLTTAMRSPGAYGFGDTHPSASIYVSQARYVWFNILRLLLLALFITLSFFRRQWPRLFVAVIALNILIFLYPMITARD